MKFSFSCQINAKPHWRLRRDRNDPALLAELGVPEHHLVLSSRELEVSDRRVAHALAVDRDAGPGYRVERHRPLRQRNSDARDAARRDLHGTHLAKADDVVDELDVVLSGWQHDAIDAAIAQQFSVLPQI